MKTGQKYLITIVGPTAIGKTALAVEVAKHFGTEIISADSRQFYKEMQIGTAVPSKEELSAVKHHFVQHISIFDSYSVGDFERDAIAKIEELFTKKDVVVMAGGSGLFINAVLNGLDEFPEVDPSIRENLNQLLKEKGIAHLQQMLKELDPLHFSKMDIQNPQRIIRALEVCLASGMPYSSFLSAKKTERNFKAIQIGLTAQREVLYGRINQRVDGMLQLGLVEEAASLYRHKTLNALQTVGYKELFTYLEGDCTLGAAVSEIKKNTRRFAKRQLTWFNKDKDIAWFDYQSPLDEFLGYFEATIKTL